MVPNITANVADTRQQRRAQLQRTSEMQNAPGYSGGVPLRALLRYKHLLDERLAVDFETVEIDA